MFNRRRCLTPLLFSACPTADAHTCARSTQMPNMSLRQVLQTSNNVAPKCQREWLIDVFSCPPHFSHPPFINRLRRCRTQTEPSHSTTREPTGSASLLSGRSEERQQHYCIIMQYAGFIWTKCSTSRCRRRCCFVYWVTLGSPWLLSSYVTMLQPLEHVSSVRVNTGIQPGASGSPSRLLEAERNPKSCWGFFFLMSVTETSRRRIMSRSDALSECSSEADYSLRPSWCQFTVLCNNNFVWGWKKINTPANIEINAEALTKFGGVN